LKTPKKVLTKEEKQKLAQEKLELASEESPTKNSGRLLCLNKSDYNEFTTNLS
jgi:hypothetical protein